MPSSPICVDASFIARLLLNTEGADNPVARLWLEWHSSGRPIVAPALLYYEVTNVLRQYVRHGDLKHEEALELLKLALNLDVALYEDPEVHLLALQLAAEFGLAATYDTHYLAVTRRVSGEFWTADARLVRRVASRFGNIRLLDVSTDG
ncbi:MAG: type II toxin-antitoxin system VapC family toxin [Calditrichaeota bacterium]|nr:type II toxin-antitoxin system VapC family toxin [Calditrichota bacterium]